MTIHSDHARASTLLAGPAAAAQVEGISKTYVDAAGRQMIAVSRS